jgi:hypothetical protein
MSQASPKPQIPFEAQTLIGRQLTRDIINRRSADIVDEEKAHDPDGRFL